MVFPIPTMGQSMWMDEEVDILVEAYAKAYKGSPCRFLTSNHWTRILTEVNHNKVGDFKKKNMSQIKNKRDALIKFHKREREKHLRGVPSVWKYFGTMEEIHHIKHGNLNHATSESITSSDLDSYSDSDSNQTSEEELPWEQCLLEDSNANKTNLELCDLSLDSLNFLSEVKSIFSVPDVEEFSTFIQNIKSDNDDEYGF